MAPDTRVIDISVTELEQLVERQVQKVLDARLPKADPKYFTVREAEKILGCSKQWIYKLMNDGRLDFRRPNGSRKIRLTQEDIDKLFKANPGYSPKKIRRKKQDQKPGPAGVE